MNELWSLDAVETARRVGSRELRAADCVQAHLDRAHELDAGLGCYRRLLEERALERASQLDASLDRGEAAPPLAGVCVAVKDLLHVAGVPTECASQVLTGYVPTFTATAVERLEAAGAIVIGKTNLDEFAMGSSTENSAWRPTRNPWDNDRVPGGSSGGSAAAVAAMLAGSALGTDTGGSIRQPAALCGVVGLKPTWGRVSRWGVVAFASSLDQVGPLTRTVEDAALVLEVIAGADPHDSTCSTRALAPAAPGAGTRGLRIGVPWSVLEEGTDAGVLEAFREALRACEREAGATLVDVELPHMGHAVATYYLVATAEASSNLARFDGVRYGLRVSADSLEQMYGATRGAGFGTEVRRRLILGTFALSAGYQDAYYRRAQQVRALIRRDFDTAFEATCDVVATPTSPTTAFRLGERTREPLQMYLSDVFTAPASLAGLPSLSLPCGRDAGLPVGLQLTGRAWDERCLLGLGAAYQRLTDHHRAIPPLARTA